MTKRLSPSGASRWLKCSGSLTLEGFEEVEKDYAVEGTIAHGLAEFCLWNDVSPFNVKVLDYEDYDGAVFTTSEIDMQMRESVDGYISFIKTIADKRYHAESVEIRSSISLTDNFTMGGTSDFRFYNPQTGELHVVDFKYGMGLPVFAEKNPQMLCYALLACEELRVIPYKVFLHIYQPRDQFGIVDEPLDSYITNYREIAEFKRRAIEIAEDVEKGAINWCIGSYCRWCDGLSACKHFLNLMRYVIAMGEATNYSNEDMKIALLVLKSFSALEESIKNEARRRLENGEMIEEFKLVAGKGARKWADEDEAEDFLERTLKERAYKKKYLSPAAAEKELGKEAVKDMWVKFPGKNRIAHNSEKGKAIVFSTEEVLKDFI